MEVLLTGQYTVANKCQACNMNPSVICCIVCPQTLISRENCLFFLDEQILCYCWRGLAPFFEWYYSHIYPETYYYSHIHVRLKVLFSGLLSFFGPSCCDLHFVLRRFAPLMCCILNLHWFPHPIVTFRVHMAMKSMEKSWNFQAWKVLENK